MAKLTGLNITNDKKVSIDMIRQILDFLDENYEILINCFNTSKSFIRSKKNNTAFPSPSTISPFTCTRKISPTTIPFSARF